MKELMDKYLNKEVRISIGGLIINVTVMDIKQRWGKNRFLVAPQSGAGEIWVESFLELNKN